LQHVGDSLGSQQVAAHVEGSSSRCAGTKVPRLGLGRGCMIAAARPELRRAGRCRHECSIMAAVQRACQSRVQSRRGKARLRAFRGSPVASAHVYIINYSYYPCWLYLYPTFTTGSGLGRAGSVGLGSLQSASWLWAGWGAWCLGAGCVRAWGWARVGQLHLSIHWIPGWKFRSWCGRRWESTNRSDCQPAATEVVAIQPCTARPVPVGMSGRLQPFEHCSACGTSAAAPHVTQAPCPLVAARGTASTHVGSTTIAGRRRE
jgi:hypothetical protein